MNMELKPDYIVGFVDAEGSFTIGYKKEREQLFGMFSVGQSEERKPILQALKVFFHCGNVSRTQRKGQQVSGGPYKASQDGYAYQVYAIRDLTIRIIPFFDEYPPILKKKEYETWRKAVLMIREGRHLTVKGKQEILSLKEAVHSLDEHPSVEPRAAKQTRF